MISNENSLKNKIFMTKKNAKIFILKVHALTIIVSLNSHRNVLSLENVLVFYKVHHGMSLNIFGYNILSF